MTDDKKRWLIEAEYGETKLSIEVEELSDIDAVVEAWPEWSALTAPIKITYQL